MKHLTTDENNSESDLEVLQKFLYNNVELERLESLVEDFNIFTALNILQKENIHSNFLSWMLDPKESHGLGDYFLIIFLKRVLIQTTGFLEEEPSIFDVEGWNFEDVEVIREWKNIDIMLRSSQDHFVCIIENKVYSKEHSKQLQRYKEIISEEYPSYKRLLIFLSIEGEPPSDEEYIPIGYNNIVEILEIVLKNKEDQIGQEIFVFINHYLKMLRRYIMKDSEIQEICKKIYQKHKKALDLIYEYKPDQLQEIYQILIEHIENDENFILDVSGKSYVRFITKNLDFIPKEGKGWTPNINRILLFEITNFPDEITLALIIGPGSQEIRKQLYQVAKRSRTIFNAVQKRTLARKWFKIYKKSLLSSKDFQDRDKEEIKVILEEKLAELTKSDIISIEEEFMSLRSQFE